MFDIDTYLIATYGSIRTCPNLKTKGSWMAKLLDTELEQTEAVEALQERKDANADVERVDNHSLPAGAPMYYYCRLCGKDLGAYPEDHVGPAPRYCSPCETLVEAGWSGSEGIFVQYVEKRCWDCRGDGHYGIDYYTKLPRTCMTCGGSGKQKVRKEAEQAS